MRVLDLRLFQFRNFTCEEISLSSGTNLFFGRNGQGKTNLIEAVYLLGFARSFRTSMPKDCIQHGQEHCRVEAVVERGTLRRELQVFISMTDKTLLVHGKPVTLVEFLGNLHVLGFTSEHLKVIRGAPGERRAFLDRAMITVYPGHVHNLAAYSRALRQRNQILKDARERGHGINESELESWDQTLASDGARIVWNRKRYVEQMKLEFPRGMFGEETLDIEYASALEADTSGAMEAEFHRRLLLARVTDERRGFTTVGPHRDELRLLLGGRSLADFGSAGQQRSSLLSLYLAQMEIHRKCHGFYPVFVMDDVEAELDGERLQSLSSYLSERTQLVLTTAKLTQLPLLAGDVRKFEVKSGSTRLWES